MGNLIVKLSNVWDEKELQYTVTKGIVYFDMKGKVIETILNDQLFETWVEIWPMVGISTRKTKIYKGKTFEKADMPKIINNSKEAIKRSKVYYQQFDHEIAAFTLIYNRELEHDKKILHKKCIFKLSETSSLFALPIINTKGLFFIGGDKYTSFPDPLDPTLVKAICMRETRCDINNINPDLMQVNNNGDWVKEKSSVGLKQGVVLKHSESIRKGILWLHNKGMVAKKYYVKELKWGRNGWDYDSAKIENITSEKGKNAELNIYTWSGDWWTAVKKYNASSKADEYLSAVKWYYQNAQNPTANDYHSDHKNYILPNIPKSL